MARAQAHRGPDDSGQLDLDHAIIAHQRLSIIDLSPCGHQPMPNEDGTVWAVFNGEIYNYRALRAELESDGHQFGSQSDTEVLVHGLESWGIAGLLPRLRGMFAFALYDARQSTSDHPGTLYLARDRFGIKPLYFATLPENGSVAFASEVRAVRRSGLVPLEEDFDAWIGFALFGSVPAPHTTLRGVRALPPAHYIVSDGASVTVRRYYDVDVLYGRPTAGSSTPRANGATGILLLEVLTRQLDDALTEAVDLHLISDAPLGIFLSGGIDSSALVALSAAKQHDLRTVGITFADDVLSEEPYQRLMAERYVTSHHNARITERDFSEAVEDFFSAMDQPTVDGVNTFFVARAARAAGLKAVLAGVGGDEVFAGYPTLDRAGRLRRFQRLAGPVRWAAAGALRHRASLRKVEFLARRGAMPLYLAQRGLHAPSAVARLLDCDVRQVWRVIESLEPEWSPADPMLLQQYLEMRFYLVDQLLRDADVFGMAHGLEIRVPLLDHPLVEMVLQSPFALRRDSVWPKPLLARTLGDRLPREVVFRRKQGFLFPLARWLGESGGALTGAATSDAERASWREFTQGRTHWSRPWSLAVLRRKRAA